MPAAKGETLFQTCFVRSKKINQSPGKYLLSRMGAQFFISTKTFAKRFNSVICQTAPWKASSRIWMRIGIFHIMVLPFEERASCCEKVARKQEKQDVRFLFLEIAIQQGNSFSFFSPPFEYAVYCNRLYRRGQRRHPPLRPVASVASARDTDCHQKCDAPPLPAFPVPPKKT